MAKTPLSWLQRTPSDQVIWLTPNRAKSLPGIFNILNEYREHKESTFAALLCVCGLVTNESRALWRECNSFGWHLTLRSNWNFGLAAGATGNWRRRESCSATESSRFYRRYSRHAVVFAIARCQQNSSTLSIRALGEAAKRVTAQTSSLRRDEARI